MRARELAQLTALALLAFFSSSWNTPLFDLDEGAFSQATLEMLDSGNYLTTTLEGRPRYDKPMLTYWLQGASVALLGRSEFAFRLHSMLAASLWMLLVFTFVRERERDPMAAWLAAAGLALSPVVGMVGHAATADALLNLLITASLLDLYRYFEAPRPGLVLRVFLWTGLGLLTKGPVAVAIPALVSLVFFAGQGRLRQWWRGVLDLRGWAVLGAVVLPWALLCWQADGGAWIRAFLLEHNLGRYRSTMHGHGGSPFYYLLALPLIVLPFTALLPAALRRGWRGDALDRYCLVWFSVVFLLFSFSKTQLPHYLLYGATPLYILFGRDAGRLPRKRWLLLPGLALLAVLLTLPAWLPHIALPTGRPWEAGILAEALEALDLHYLAIALAAAALALLAARLDRARALIGMALAQGLLLWFALLPLLAAAQQGPIRAAAEHARRLGGPVVSFRTHLPSFSVYRGAVTPRRDPVPGELVFLRADRLDALQARYGAEALRIEFRDGGVVLARRLQ